MASDPHVTVTDDAAPDDVPSRCSRCGTAYLRVHACAWRSSAPAWVAPPVIGPLPVGAPVRRFDVSTHRWDAARDLERLAEPKWFRMFYGRGQNIEPQVRGTGERGPASDQASAIDRERVAAIFDRLEGLRSRAGCLHHAVLNYVYLLHGPAQRMPAASLVQGVERDRAELSSTFLEQLGKAFASPAQRKRWRSMSVALRHSLPTKYGEQLHAAAVAAYEHG